MTAIRPLAFSTYGETVRRPLYCILLLIAAALIYFSKLLTLFSFYQEINAVREMGMATITLWSFLVIVITSGLVVTRELEDRTAVTLLSKPLLRRDFLLGKYLGLLLALVPGIVFLTSTLYLTLWMMAWPNFPLTDADVARGLEQGHSPFVTTAGAIWDAFILRQGGVVLQGSLLAFFQSAILAALAVSFSAFLPVPVSVAAVSLAYILGNISSYMLASVEILGVGPLSAAGRAFTNVMPNLGYFNLQTHFSEGKIISSRYLALSFAYASLYVGAVFLVACSLFRRREIR